MQPNFITEYSFNSVHTVKLVCCTLIKKINKVKLLNVVLIIYP